MNAGRWAGSRCVSAIANCATSTSASATRERVNVSGVLRITASVCNIVFLSQRLRDKLCVENETRNWLVFEAKNHVCGAWFSNHVGLTAICGGCRRTIGGISVAVSAACCVRLCWGSVCRKRGILSRLYDDEIPKTILYSDFSGA